MSNRMVSREVIKAIREAAQTRDWNQCHPPLERALAELEPATLIALAEAVLREGLPTFERNHPGEMWPRRALDGLETGLSPDVSGPGGGSFCSAVDDLVEARARADDSSACHKLIAKALSRSIMAEMSAIWGAEHREAWDAWYGRPAESEPLGCADPMWGWSDDPKVLRAEIAGWNNLADRLEALERPGDDTEDASTESDREARS